MHQEHDDVMEEIKKESSIVNSQIKQLKIEAEKEKVNGYMTTEGKMKRDQVTVLVLMFQEVMSEFNQIQFQHRDHCKARIKRQFEICGQDINENDIEEMIEKGNVDVFSKQMAIDDFAKSQKILQEVENRHLEILKLEQSIEDLLEIFQEIAMYVDMQGGMIDNIQHNVGETLIRVEESQRELKKAMHYKQKSIFTCCCPAFIRNTIPCTVM